MPSISTSWYDKGDTFPTEISAWIPVNPITSAGFIEPVEEVRALGAVNG